MPRPKGSKNRKTVVVVKAQPTVTPLTVEQEIDVAEENELEEVELLAQEGEEDGYEVDEDEEDDDVVLPSGPPPGMSLVQSVSQEPSGTSGSNDVLGAIREQTETLKRIMGPQKVSFGALKTKSTFNPTGKNRKLKFVVYQNGYRCNVKTLFDKEVDLINSGRIRSGQYLEKLVTVRVVLGGPGDDGKIFFSYNNKTIDQRLSNKNHWNGFGDLLEKVILEGEARKKRIAVRRAQLSA